ncbi:MAG: KilA-N domain-containing protein [Planctomycetes bacterium]|nr:KilA-N domain-containing protein [Planctomycetota bacterium]
MLVQSTVISFTRIQQGDFISLTDIAKVKNPDEPKDVVKNWLRSRSTLDFLGLWERINNPNFKGVEFDSFKAQAGTNSFTLSPSKWIDSTGAIGIRSTAGRTGGTYAHQDIAFEFASWVSAEFKLYLIKEFQRLKDDEIQAKSLEWNLTRSLSKLNYRIHTDAIAENIIPQAITKQQAGLIYASEADVLNVALFGITAKQWRDQNNAKQGNMRDHASVEQLIILSNMESINAELIRQDLPQSERLLALNNTAIHQMRSLLGNTTVLKIK